MDTSSQSTVVVASSSSEKPTILLVSLAAVDSFNSQYASLINTLNERTNLKKSKTAAGTARFLESNTPDAIIITDQGLTRAEGKTVIEKLATYVRAGGLVIVGLHFPQYSSGPAFKAFFRNFGVPWEAADLATHQVRFNVGSELPGKATPIAISPYTAKVLLVKNALPREKIVVPVERQVQAAVVGAKVGEGFVVYAGDTNPGPEADQIILSLCGL
jgi:hypothetical protein